MSVWYKIFICLFVFFFHFIIFLWIFFYRIALDFYDVFCIVLIVLLLVLVCSFHFVSHLLFCWYFGPLGRNGIGYYILMSYRSSALCYHRLLWQLLRAEINKVYNDLKRSKTFTIPVFFVRYAKCVWYKTCYYLELYIIKH